MKSFVSRITAFAAAAITLSGCQHNEPQLSPPIPKTPYLKLDTKGKSDIVITPPINGHAITQYNEKGKSHMDSIPFAH